MIHYTKQFGRLGETTYDVTLGGWENDEPFTIATFEAPSFEAAKEWAASQPKVSDKDEEVIDVCVYRGTYVEDSGHVAGYGLVRDASWVQDDAWGANGWWDEDGRLHWHDWGS